MTAEQCPGAGGPRDVPRIAPCSVPRAARGTATCAMTTISHCQGSRHAPAAPPSHTDTAWTMLPWDWGRAAWVEWVRGTLDAAAAAAPWYPWFSAWPRRQPRTPSAFGGVVAASHLQRSALHARPLHRQQQKCLILLSLATRGCPGKDWRTWRDPPACIPPRACVCEGQCDHTEQ